MRSLLPLILYCISLLISLQINALPVANRLDFMTKLHEMKPKSPASSDSMTGLISDPAVSLDRTTLWRALLQRSPTLSIKKPQRNHVSPSPSFADGAFTDNLRSIRRRRSAHPRSHHLNKHGQLMRVGCILGTCQVQNLSHRLYQLIGQNGREDASPISPHSPHSYG